MRITETFSKMWITRTIKNHARVILLGFMLCSLLLCGLSLLFPSRVTSEEGIIEQKDQLVGKIYDGIKVEHVFQSPKKDLKGIDLISSTYGKNLQEGTIHFEIWTQETKILDYDAPMTQIHDDQLVWLSFPIQGDSKGKEYKLIISSSGCTEENSVSFWMGSKKENQSVQTFINGIQVNGSALNFILVFEKNNYKFLWPLLLIATIFFTLSGVVPGKKRKVERGSTDR